MSLDDFKHTLPSGEVAEHAQTRNVFQAICEELEVIKQDLNRVIADIDEASIKFVKECQSLASKRGEFLIVEDKQGIKSLDVIVLPKPDPKPKKRRKAAVCQPKVVPFREK